MLVSIGAYVLCDGTLENGVAVSDLRLDQRRIADVVPVLPDQYRILLSVAGVDYVAGDLLTISADGELATMSVTVVSGAGAILGFQVITNTFTAIQSSLAATGGSGSGAEFSVSITANHNATSPKTYDRTGRPCAYSFTVKRTHNDVDAAEQFIINLENALPATGTISITTTGPTAATFEVPNGKVQSHELVAQLGATTFHSYSIIGGPPPTET